MTTNVSGWAQSAQSVRLRQFRCHNPGKALVHAITREGCAWVIYCGGNRNRIHMFTARTLPSRFRGVLSCMVMVAGSSRGRLAFFVEKG